MRTVLVIVALLLAGCGQRVEPGKEAAPVAVVAAPVKEQKRDDRPAIVAFGDSLSAGYGLEAGESYPDFLQKKLDEKGYRYRVVNQGVSGDTTSGGVERIAQSLAEKPWLGILELGGNDGFPGLPVSRSLQTRVL